MSRESEKIWFFENFNLFDCLSKAEKERLSDLTKMREASRSQIIFLPQDPSNSLYFLKSGQVKVSSYSEEGKEITHALLGPGELFGELALTGQGRREMIAEATEDALVCIVHVDDFEKMLEENPCLNLRITKLIGLRLKRVNMRLQRLWFKSAPERVRALVKDLVEDYGLEEDGMITIHLSLTHQDMANLAATSRQTVTSTLSALERQGIISYSRKLIKVIDPEALKSI